MKTILNELGVEGCARDAPMRILKCAKERSAEIGVDLEGIKRIKLRIPVDIITNRRKLGQGDFFPYKGEILSISHLAVGVIERDKSLCLKNLIIKPLVNVRILPSPSVWKMPIKAKRNLLGLGRRMFRRNSGGASRSY